MRVSVWLYALEQLVCALCILPAAGRTACLPHPQPGRLILICMLCAAASTLAALLPVCRAGALTLILLSPVLVWPDAPRPLRLRLCGVVLSLTLLLGGCMRLALSTPLPCSLCLLLSCCALPAPASLIHREPPLQCACVEPRCGQAKITLTALTDSGNLLRDPLTALPVIVISRRAARRLIPAPQPGKLNPGLRQITVRTAAGLSAMTVFRPSSVRLLCCGAWRECRAAVGIAPADYDGVQALLPAVLLESARPTIPQGGTSS